MAVICPTVTAYDEYEYNEQVVRLRPFAQRIHIDLMDGDFAPVTSPELNHIWWPHDIKADLHLMYQHPQEHLERLIELKPNLVIIHNEADVHHMYFAAQLHKHGIKTGLAILRETPVEWCYQIMHSFDHVLVFSGNLGHQGGEADLGLLDKVQKIRQHHPEVEIGWDGGINDQNINQLQSAGVNVLNVGGYIAKSSQPAEAFNLLQSRLAV